MAEEQVLEIIYKAVDVFNRQHQDRYQLTKSRDTVLFGCAGVLDSLGLVNFIVATEQQIEESLDKPITLADARAVSQKNSPFRTIATLEEYIKKLL